MFKAIGSSIDLFSNDNPISIEYSNSVSDLFMLDSVKKLDNYSQHLNTSRLQHSLNVSYYSFRMAKFLGLDYRAAARGGLLHDLYYYEFKNVNMSCSKHSKHHPAVALENAKLIADITALEEDIILSHMWPMSPKSPSHRESFIVTFFDKVCASLEVATQVIKSVNHKKCLAVNRNKQV